MQKLQEVFNHTQKVKAEQRSLKAMYRDALANSGPYKQVVDKIKELRDAKKQIEDAIRSDFKSELEKLDAIKTDLESDKIMMSDLALNEIIKGNEIEVIDEHSNKYEPIFGIRFKKIG